VTIEQCVCIAIGCVMQGATFVLGVLVGLSMRKDSHRDGQGQGLGGSEPMGRKL
jgi:hypothetical protein